MKKIKNLFWSLTRGFLWVLFFLFIIWFFNNHFVKFDILRFLGHYFNRWALQFFSNLFATFEFYTREVVVVTLPVAVVYLFRASFSEKVGDIITNSNETVRDNEGTLIQISDFLRRALKYGRTEEEVLRGLLVATYKGEFKEKLFSDEPQPTEHEIAMTDLARKVQDKSLSQEQLNEAINTLKKENAKVCEMFGNSPAEKTEDLIMFFISNPQWKGFGSKQIGSISIDMTFDKKMRPLATELVTEKSLIGNLSWHEQRFNDFFPEKDLPETFDELRKKFPVEFQHFLRVDPQEYELIRTWQEIFQSKTSIFLQDFKKMKISGKTFKVWLKRFLNGDFD